MAVQASVQDTKVMVAFVSMNVSGLKGYTEPMKEFICGRTERTYVRTVRSRQCLHFCDGKLRFCLWFQTCLALKAWPARIYAAPEKSISVER